MVTGILGVWLALACARSAGSSFTEKRQASVERLRNGNVFKPVPPTTVPGVAATDAWETVKREFPELAEQPVEAALALVTTEGQGKMGPAGSLTPRYRDRLAWVFTVRDVEVFPLLGGALCRVPAGRPGVQSSRTAWCGS